nr:Aspartate-semialdehyde dehydrogenase [Salmonella sp. NCTC 7297]
MKNVGFIGWRGMGRLCSHATHGRGAAISTLFALFSFLPPSLDRRRQPSGDTSTGTLQDAFDLDALKALDIIVTCQGGDYTNEIYPKLRESGWQGYWIDAASTLRMKDDAIIILDPVNQDVITDGLNNGVKTFVAVTVPLV